MARLAVVIHGLEGLIPLLGVGSDAGRDALKALNMLAKHIPAGSVSPAGEKNQMEQMMLKRAQMQPQIAAMRAASMSGGGGAAPGGAPPAAA